MKRFKNKKQSIKRTPLTPENDSVAKEIIAPLVENHKGLQEKLMITREKFEKIKDEFPENEQNEIFSLIWSRIRFHHMNPWLAEMEKYEKSTFTEDITFEMEIPSGKIVIHDHMDGIFPPSKEIATREKQWNMILHPERARYYGTLNTAYVRVNDTYPRTVINSHGDVLFDYFPSAEVDDEFIDIDRFYCETVDKKSLIDGETLTGYVAKSYSMHIADYDAWIKAGGDENELLSGEEIWQADEYTPVVIPVIAGRYRFTSYASNDNFWKQKSKFDTSRGSVAKMELIEAY